MIQEQIVVKVENGAVYTHGFSFSQEEVNRFAQVTGDCNPIHLDATYAAATAFKRPIMHGFLGGSIFSKVFGTLFPGEGTIYLKQTMSFVKPMYTDTPYVATFTVKEVQLEKHRAIIETVISEKETGDATIKGEAVVLNMNVIV